MQFAGAWSMAGLQVWMLERQENGNGNADLSLAGGLILVKQNMGLEAFLKPQNLKTQYLLHVPGKDQCSITFI